MKVNNKISIPSVSMMIISSSCIGTIMSYKLTELIQTQFIRRESDKLQEFKKIALNKVSEVQKSIKRVSVGVNDGNR